MRRLVRASLPIFRYFKPKISPEHLAARLLDGDRLALSRAITLVESRLPSDRDYVQVVLEHLNSSTILEDGSIEPPSALRIGVCGSPGAGKSTFIESFGLHLLSLGQTIGVIAVDPSSVVTGGSILGDKTRMECLSREDRAFIRPSPSEGFLGGVAPNTYEIITLMEFAGFDTILVETVGIGQSETAVKEMTDIVALVVPPSSGDELQGIKRGVMEIADFVLVNKHDGPRIADAEKTRADYSRALHMMQPKYSFRPQEVLLMSSMLDTRGRPQQSVVDVWDTLCEFGEQLDEQGIVDQNRQEQKEAWIWRQVNEEIVSRLFLQDSFRDEDFVEALKHEVFADVISPRVAAERILDRFLESQDIKKNSRQ